jgi:exportin-1
MINQDFMEYPEHRTGFYKLLTAINKTCFPGSPSRHGRLHCCDADISRTALLTLPPTQFKLLIDSIVWGMKHTMRDIAEIALNRRLCIILILRRSLTVLPLSPVCLEVVNNFSTADPQVSNQFFQQYFLSIMQDVFFVLTDTDHKSGFKLQSMVLARLFQLVQTGAIGVPLFDPSTVPDPNMSNSLFLQEYTATLLKNAFPHLQPYAQLPFPLPTNC